MNFSKLIISAIVTLSLTGCASLHSVSVTRVPKERNAPIQAEQTSFGILGIFLSNQFAEDAVKELESKCANGKISGILTQYESRFYLLWVTRKVKATGYCLKNSE